MSHTVLIPVRRANLTLARPAPFPRLVLPARCYEDVAKPWLARRAAPVTDAPDSFANRDEDPERWDGLA